MYRLILLAFLTLAPLLLTAQPFTMFPGDANNDGRADQFDLLPIGVAYGQEGFPRPGATLGWLPQNHPQQWPLALPVSGVNLGFCDSDGNGFIDSLDVDAISLNFDSTQGAAMPPPLPYLLPDTCFSCPKPTLLITFDRDTAMVGDTFYATLTIIFPPNVPPQAGALGIAFNLSYDPENVKDSLTKVFPDTMPGDLMFVAATSTLARSWRAVPAGSIGFGAAGKGSNALFFPRPLGVVELVVEDLIIRSTAVDFSMQATDFLIVNAGEQVVSMGEVLPDTIVLFNPVDAVNEPTWQEKISVSPNPAGDWLRVTSALAPLEKIECFTLDGRRMPTTWEGHGTTAALPLGAFPEGIFWVKIQTAQGVLTKKIVKSR